MGQYQSAGRSGLKTIPVRPRTPLRFGSVPTALPVDPTQYNTRPIRHLYAEQGYTDSLTSLLSQDNYLYPRPTSSDTSDPFDSTASSSIATPSSATSGEFFYEPMNSTDPPRFELDYPESPLTWGPQETSQASIQQRNAEEFQRQQIMRIKQERDAKLQMQAIQQCECKQCLIQRNGWGAANYPAQQLSVPVMMNTPFQPAIIGYERAPEKPWWKGNQVDVNYSERRYYPSSRYGPM